METPTPDTPERADSNATIDASRPFHSVKEAVAIFGKRIFLGEMQPPLKHHSPVVPKDTSTPHDEFTASRTFELASPTYELKLNPEKSTSSELTPISAKNPSFLGVENGVSDSSEFTPTSDKPPSFFVENGISSSSEFTKSPNVTSLGNANKEAASSSVYEPPTPSPINPKIPSTSYPTPNFSWEMGISAPATPSISSKEIEPSPRYGNPKTDNNHGKAVHGNDLVMMLMILKRLESELQETKMELKELKERESETEVALASLNAQLHKHMSKIAKAEAAEAAKAAAKSGTLVDDDGSNRETSSRWRDHDVERSNSEVIMKQVDSPTLAQILSITDYDCYFENSNKLKKKMKKKPIIPLITDIFPWRKRSPSSNNYDSAPVFSWH